MSSADTHRLWLKLSNKVDLKGSDKYLPLSNPSIYYTSKKKMLKKEYKKSK